MNVPRPRLLVASLLAAVVVGVLGGIVWARTVAEDGPAVDAELTDARDRTLPTTVGELTPNGRPDALPAAAMSDVDGRSVSTSDLLGGDPLVINLWFSTCAPCAKELPDFAEVHAEVGDRVRFVGVNTLDSVPVMQRFASERGVDYELLRDDLAEFTDGIEASNFPITVFATSDGTVVDQSGVLDADGLRERVDRLLAAEEDVG
ncbi:TlpA family protein disulfide reductase [Ilumatobacter sp.]|uniref:TlpA family protein disulfide reductase n=1 Tax=Ilumatobacter sp. TaxID=1967498 RepID=UPI003B517D01